MTFRYLEKLKEELKLIQKSINCDKVYPKTSSVSEIWESYEIILNGGTALFINRETVFFPKINFKGILLIIKRDWSYCGDDGEHFFDSEMGDYISEKQNLYGIEIKNKIYTYEDD